MFVVSFTLEGRTEDGYSNGFQTDKIGVSCTGQSIYHHSIRQSKD